MNKKLVFKKDGIEYMHLCADITVYWTGSVFSHKEGVLSFYHQAIDLIGKELKHYETEEMQGTRPIDKDALDLIPSWLTSSEEQRETYMLKLESNSVRNLPSDTAFDFWAVEYAEEPAGAVRLILPVTWMERSPRHFFDLTKKLVNAMDFHSGHAGFALNWDYKGDYASLARREMGVLSRRFPSIDLPDLACTLIAIPAGIKRVNWLTLIGNGLLGSVGGLDGLGREFSGHDILVEQLAHGVIIMAGEQASVGDVNRQETLPALHNVGREIH